MLELSVNDTTSLKQLQPEHAAALFKQIDTHRKSLRRFLPWVDYNTNEEHSLRFIEMMLRKADDQDAIAMGIWNEGVLCGVIDLHSWDHLLLKAEIGYWIANPYQGKGIVTACCKVLITYAFTMLKLNKIEIHFAIQNERSAHIPMKLGFAKEGVLRHNARLHGQYVDMVVMGVLREDWKYFKAT